MARKLFLVYAIDADNQPAADASGTAKSVAFTPAPRGCYFARSPEEACVRAAERFGRAGDYVAVRTVAERVGFKASGMSEGAIKKLEKKARRRLKRR